MLPTLKILWLECSTLGSAFACYSHHEEGVEFLGFEELLGFTSKINFLKQITETVTRNPRKGNTQELKDFGFV